MTRIVRMFLTAFALVLPLIVMSCEAGKDYELKSDVFLSGKHTIQPGSFLAQPFSVTDAMRTVPTFEDVITLHCFFEMTDEREISFYVLDEDNYLAWEQRLPFSAIDPQASGHNVYAGSFYLPHMKNGSYYVVFDNRDGAGDSREVSATFYLDYFVFK